MNILEQALRRIAVRKTDNLIVKSFVTATNQDSIPKHYVPKVPTFGHLVKTILISPISLLGAFGILGLATLLSFNLAIILGVLVVLISIGDGILAKSTPDIKSVPLHINDRRYKEGYRIDGYIDIEDPENVIYFTPKQRAYKITENTIISIVVILALIFIHMIVIYEQQPK